MQDKALCKPALLMMCILIDAGSSSSSSPTREPAAAPAAEGPASSSALGNDRMAWELLYDLRWRLPTEELDLAWSDALGTTSVMQVGQWCCRGCQEWSGTLCQLHLRKQPCWGFTSCM